MSTQKPEAKPRTFTSHAPKAAEAAPAPAPEKKEVEYGGPKGPEPTRYGDWERGGRCSDF
ncbi:DUF1674 domain-containing protein [Lacibacterium aquatile]|uniref:DUF1674 domain-containing protein n=1 Tax=Lacibacterium aquatile TaxID=1168082 RepID=A0ABW5DU83_9PROT